MHRLLKIITGKCLFEGEAIPGRVPIFKSGRPTLPFPHPWNYQKPIDILETYFWNADHETGCRKHNRYLQIPGFAPILVTRDPVVIREITVDTGDKPGQFDRDTLPSTGIARATGEDTLLYSNGEVWRRQRKISASPFGKTTLFQPEKFQEFADTFRETVLKRLEVLRTLLAQGGAKSHTLQLEPEIKAVMLELLTNNFFGTEISYDEIRNRYVPALERTIDHIVRDTVLNKIGIRKYRLPGVTSGLRQLKQDYAGFEELTDRVLAMRKADRGLWKQFKSEAPDEKLRSNIKVFLAGALEATTSYASWAISHLARNPTIQQKVYETIKDVTDYTPENLEQSKYFVHVLDETLRLTPSLYFLPRKATADTSVQTCSGKPMKIPKSTHILLDVWHANRAEDFWGIERTGYPPNEFHPERWEEIDRRGYASKDVLHFGFGHGPRVCPGKHLGQLEVALIVGATVQLFKLSAPNVDNPVKAGVSTKPADGTLVELELRD